MAKVPSSDQMKGTFRIDDFEFELENNASQMTISGRDVRTKRLFESEFALKQLHDARFISSLAIEQIEGIIRQALGREKEAFKVAVGFVSKNTTEDVSLGGTQGTEGMLVDTRGIKAGGLEEKKEASTSGRKSIGRSDLKSKYKKGSSLGIVITHDLGLFSLYFTPRKIGNPRIGYRKSPKKSPNFLKTSKNPQKSTNRKNMSKIPKFPLFLFEKV